MTHHKSPLIVLKIKITIFSSYQKTRGLECLHLCGSPLSLSLEGGEASALRPHLLSQRRGTVWKESVLTKTSSCPTSLRVVLPNVTLQDWQSLKLSCNMESCHICELPTRCRHVKYTTSGVRVKSGPPPLPGERWIHRRPHVSDKCAATGWHLIQQ